VRGLRDIISKWKERVAWKEGPGEEASATGLGVRVGHII
jgi:hypothetical protein